MSYSIDDFKDMCADYKGNNIDGELLMKDCLAFFEKLKNNSFFNNLIHNKIIANFNDLS